MNENTEIVVGIDISKDTLDIGFRPSGQSVSFTHDEEGITEVMQRLSESQAAAHRPGGHGRPGGWAGYPPDGGGVAGGGG